MRRDDPVWGGSCWAKSNRPLRASRSIPRLALHIKESGFRHVVLRRFQYILFCQELPDVIWIAAVAHGKRRPGYWRSREIE